MEFCDECDTTVNSVRISCVTVDYCSKCNNVSGNSKLFDYSEYIHPSELQDIIKKLQDILTIQQANQ